MEETKMLDNLRTSLDSLETGKMKLSDAKDSFIIGFILSYYISKYNVTISSKDFEKIKNGYYRTKLDSDSEEETLLVFIDRIIKDTFRTKENKVFSKNKIEEIDLVSSDISDNNNFKSQRKEETKKENSIKPIVIDVSTKTGEIDDNDYMECEICCEKFSIFDPKNVDLQNCDCFIHYDCFVTYLETEINSRKIPILCPVANCKKEIPTLVIEWSLKERPELLRKLEKFTFDNYMSMNSDQVSCCPTPGCEYLFFFEKKDGTHFSCPICKKHYCLKCKVDYHFNLSCEEYFKFTDKKV